MPELKKHVEKLDSTDPVDRAKALKGLLAAGKEAVPHFADAMSSKYADVRYYSAKILGKIGDDQSVQALIKAHEDAKDEEGRKLIEEALKKIQRRSNEPDSDKHIRMLKHELPEKRKEAINGLAREGDLAVEHLGKALWDEDHDVQISAAAALRKINTPKAAMEMLKFLHEVRGTSTADPSKWEMPELFLMFVDGVKKSILEMESPELVKMLIKKHEESKDEKEIELIEHILQEIDKEGSNG